ncbi:hypothetical protein GCM10010172_07550 [Paractinoplanes ferrugineus]|uniref:Uncharacterized protein n=1 Tax=Paractinoplanes ferrugineus TaxID=113564 RepID=A0A919JC11_9ACTN|nr:hypothetical protein [Actinoplanes ferrugineus]GIE16858.1 hypothetical protein Afe05nite_86980 [Actinoplanes ferrugineus]
MADNLTRWGYDAEVRRHHDNLARALDEASRVAASLTGSLERGDQELASEARRLAAAAVDVVQYAGALSAARQLVFTVEES